MGYKNNGNCKNELADKLANYRRKLARGIGRKKITQEAFGEMFGGFSYRQIASYELADAEIPVLLLYKMWKAKFSVDRFFGEEALTDEEMQRARDLYAQTTGQRIIHLGEEDLTKLFSTIEEKAHHVKDSHAGTTHEGSSQTSGKRKGSASAQGKNKKR